MEFVRDTLEITSDRDSAVTLGKFDGLHRGHQLLMRELSAAGREGLKTVVFTFGTHPRALVSGKPQELLLTNEEKRDMLSNGGIDQMVEFPFNDTTAHMAPEEFVTEILVKGLHARKIIAGTDFCFGYRRAGNVALLEKMSRDCGFRLVVKEKLKTREGIDISSTYIKDMLRLGHMKRVNEMLGYPYFIRGEIIPGNHYGRTFGMPTINQLPAPEKLLPPNGVYVSRTILDGKEYTGVTNIGTKPTIEGTYPRGVETYLDGFDGDAYGKIAEVRLYYYGRPEMKFDSKEDLIAQMHRDQEAALAYWERHEAEKKPGR